MDITKELITETINELDKLSFMEKEENLLKRIDLTKNFLTEINKNLENFFEVTPYTYSKMRDSLRKNLLEMKNANNQDSKKKLAEDIYIHCMYFLREYIFYQEMNSVGMYNSFDEFFDIYNFFLQDDGEKLTNSINYARLDHIKNKLHIWILGYYYCSKSFYAFQRYEESIEKGKQEVNKIQNDIASEKQNISDFITKKKSEVAQLANTLDKQKTAFNFVGLSQGFENLRTQKNKAKLASFVLMLVIGVALIFLPALFIDARFLNWFTESNIYWRNVSWEQILPVVGLEFVLIYFFRVVLNHYNSIQTQIMQIDLRQALCQFIQSYVEYAKEIKEKDEKALEKFENLIFSSILSTPDKVPSTFDGIDQFANFIKEIKKG